MLQVQMSKQMIGVEQPLQSAKPNLVVASVLAAVVVSLNVMAAAILSPAGLLVLLITLMIGNLLLGAALYAAVGRRGEQAAEPINIRPLVRWADRQPASSSQWPELRDAA